MSLDRAAVVRHYKQLCVELGLEHKDVVLAAGAALVLLGLRKYTSDLDADVPVSFFEKLKEHRKPYDTIVGEVIAWDEMVEIKPTTKEIANGGKLNLLGVWIYHPEQLLKQKELLANDPRRPVAKSIQDYKDIQGLKELLDNVYLTKTHLDKSGLQLQVSKVS